MPEEPDPKKYHVLSSNMKKKLALFLVIFVFIISPLIMVKYYELAVTRPSQTANEATIDIGKGDSVSEISDELYTRGAINSGFLFNLYVFLTKSDKSLQAGIFTIPAGTSIKDLVEILKEGRDDKKITFIEGWRVEEFAREAAKAYGNIEYKKFLDLAKEHEGYLFPDTYLFNSDIEEEELVNYLLATFESKTEDVFTADKIKKTGLTKEQIIVLASIVERETRTDEEKPVIAGILIKRLNEGAKLEADATTQYAVALKEVCSNFYDQSDNFCTPTQEDLMEMDWWPSTLTIDDINFENQYNTRKVTGLPPAPISSVGLSSINGVVNYAETDYYFYLHGSNGDVHYARTLDEHNANIANYIN